MEAAWLPGTARPAESASGLPGQVGALPSHAQPAASGDPASHKAAATAAGVAVAAAAAPPRAAPHPRALSSLPEDATCSGGDSGAASPGPTPSLFATSPVAELKARDDALPSPTGSLSPVRPFPTGSTSYRRRSTGQTAVSERLSGGSGSGSGRGGALLLGGFGRESLSRSRNEHVRWSIPEAALDGASETTHDAPQRLALDIKTPASSSLPSSSVTTPTVGESGSRRASPPSPVAIPAAVLHSSRNLSPTRHHHPSHKHPLGTSPTAAPSALERLLQAVSLSELTMQGAAHKQRRFSSQTGRASAKQLKVHPDGKDTFILASHAQLTPPSRDDVTYPTAVHARCSLPVQQPQQLQPVAGRRSGPPSGAGAQAPATPHGGGEAAAAAAVPVRGLPLAAAAAATAGGSQRTQGALPGTDGGAVGAGSGPRSGRQAAIVAGGGSLHDRRRSKSHIEYSSSGQASGAERPARAVQLGSKSVDKVRLYDSSSSNANSSGQVAYDKDVRSATYLAFGGGDGSLQGRDHSPYGAAPGLDTASGRKQSFYRAHGIAAAAAGGDGAASLRRSSRNAGAAPNIFDVLPSAMDSAHHHSHQSASSGVRLLHQMRDLKYEMELLRQENDALKVALEHEQGAREEEAAVLRRRLREAQNQLHDRHAVHGAQPASRSSSSSSSSSSGSSSGCFGGLVAWLLRVPKEKKETGKHQARQPEDEGTHVGVAAAIKAAQEVVAY